MPSYPIEASGHTSVILLLNMRRFVPEEARGAFESLRGTDMLQAIQNWAQEDINRTSLFRCLIRRGVAKH